MPKDAKNAKHQELRASLSESIRLGFYHLALRIIGPSEDKPTWMEAGETYGLASSTIYGCASGRGSLESYLQLICGELDLKPADIEKKLASVYQALASHEEAREVEELVSTALALYGDHEFAARLRLLIANYEMEQGLGLRKSKTRPHKK